MSPTQVYPREFTAGTTQSSALKGDQDSCPLIFTITVVSLGAHSTQSDKVDAPLSSAVRSRADATALHNAGKLVPKLKAVHAA